MKKILFGITSLGLGGAERVLVDIANKICKEYDVSIFTIYSNGEMEKQLNPNVKLQSLINKKYEELTKIEKIIIPIKIMLRRKAIYRKSIQKDYDVEIAFLEGPVTRLFSTKNKSTKKIAWIHNDITKVFGSGIKAKIKKIIDKKIYASYSKLVFVSKDNKEKFEKVYSLNIERTVIYNYIDIDTVIKKSNEKCDINFENKTLNIVAVSRLVEQKAIDRLINVHSKLIGEGLKHKIYVIGDGPKKDELVKLIQEKNVKDSFILLGKKENPYPYIKNADCFALLSYFEGYPMVLLEAQILEKYIIITDTAARETLRNYNNCMIVENSEDGIYNGLSKLIANKDKDKYINERDNQSKYDNENIIIEIKKLIEE